MKFKEYPMSIKSFIGLGIVFSILAVLCIVAVLFPVCREIMSSEYWILACVLCWFIGICLSVCGNIKRLHYKEKKM